MASSTLDWSKLCDVALDVRRRLMRHLYLHEGVGKNTAPFVITEADATMLIQAALEYSDLLAHEAGRERRRKRA